MPSLASPLVVGGAQLKHRLVMAPLTRFRSDDDHVPLDLVTEYYEQRANSYSHNGPSGSMLITEATFISPQASGYPSVPGIWSKEQIAQWKKVTAAVHAKGSFIFLQLWALGRAANPEELKKMGHKLVSSSPSKMADNSPVPSELDEKTIHSFIADYAQAAKNAVEAGFDGVEIHGANGYLIDQFTQDNCNKRTDKWGGSIENRARFGIEVAKAVVDAIGAERTGIRLSPWSTFQGMRMEDPVPQFSYLIEELKKLKLCYLHLVESRITGNADIESTDKIEFALDIWGKTSPVVVAGGFKAASAKRVFDEYPNNDILVAFGRYYISNPDLPFRIINDVELSGYDRDTFYNPRSPKGYIDYPYSKEFLESEGAGTKL
ncbi:hypothetical protein MMC25_000694 [Agyrium rufum]|nr:hypothetical protein [Agyrium rufum]